MKVFLSWSGDLSLKVAGLLRDWLPSVLQHVTPYVSSEDIDKGARWSTDIAKELELSAYGIICVTRDNLDAPWIHFEAGALSKTVDKARVTPFLTHVKRSDIQGPLLQFQSTIADKDDVGRLLSSINNASSEEQRLDSTRLAKVFDVWWPQLASALDALPDSPKASTRKAADKRPEPDSILEEVLTLVRNQERLLRTPEQLLPPQYIAFAVSQAAPELRGRSRHNESAWDFLFERVAALRTGLERAKSDNPDLPATHAISEDDVRAINDVVEYLAKHSISRSHFQKLTKPTG